MHNHSFQFSKQLENRSSDKNRHIHAQMQTDKNAGNEAHLVLGHRVFNKVTKTQKGVENIQKYIFIQNLVCLC
mgnify:CR=1 FL=1